MKIEPDAMPDHSQCKPDRAATQTRLRFAATPSALILAVAAYFMVVLNQPFWSYVASQLEGGLTGSLLLASQIGLFLLGLIVLVLSLARFPYVLKPAIALLLIASAGVYYFMQQYGVVIDDDMLRNAIQTDNAEVAGLLNWSLAGTIIGLGVLPAWLLTRIDLRWSGPIRNLFQSFGVCALGLAIGVSGVAIDFQAAAPFIRENGSNMKWRASPLNLIEASYKVIRSEYKAAWPAPFVPIASRAGFAPGMSTSENNLVVLVIGETARSMNFSLNGYLRPTNPELSQLPVTSFSRVSSCGTSTAISVPCEFSNLAREEFSASGERNRENLVDLAKRAGYRVIWIDNQAGSKGVADRVEFQYLERVTEGVEETPDADFIPAFRQILKAPAGPLLLVLHQMGSHGPEYFKRSMPERKQFMPECQDKRFENCSLREIVNAYDNSITETDHVIAGLIKTVNAEAPQRPVTLLYLADHGESLGEAGLFLHGMPYSLAPKEQISVPMIYWANAPGAKLTRTDQHCLAGMLEAPMSHDNFFHIVLGLLGLQTDAYRIGQDSFAACRPALTSNP